MAAAPSLMLEALPAVTVPSGAEGGAELAELFFVETFGLFVFGDGDGGFAGGGVYGDDLRSEGSIGNNGQCARW